MAKEQQLNGRDGPTPTANRGGAKRTGKPSALRFNASGMAIAWLTGMLVYVAYFPSDSVAVERGDALWFTALAIGLYVLGVIGSIRGDTETNQPLASGDRTGSHWTDLIASRLLDVLPCLLAGWMMIAAFAPWPRGNLRMSTNEAWFWVAAPLVLIATRRIVAAPAVKRGVLGVIVVIGTALAIHGLHQHYVSLPQTRAEYRADAESSLQQAGVVAPPGSSERMVFENRLFDGGPSGTFALANSLAAILLITIVIAVSVLAIGWRSMSWWEVAAWLLVLGLVIPCLVATRSRSGVGSAIVGVVLALVLNFKAGGYRWRRWLIGVGLVCLLLVAGVTGLAIAGNPEWLEQAPASLSFRFQYWRSTLALAWDYPVFGARPGNFQSLYERYREASANEQIAEPHNFLIETLASGGFPAAALLVVIIGSTAVLGWRALPRALTPARSGSPLTAARSGSPLTPTLSPTKLGEREQEGPLEASRSSAKLGERDQEEAPLRWLVLGGLVSLALIWVLGIETGALPDLDAQLWALPIAMLIAIVVVPSAIRRLTSTDATVVAIAAILTVMLHLSVSGGWTVPGIALPVWVLGAFIAGAPYSRSSRDGTIAAPNQRVRGANSSRWQANVGVAAIGLALVYGLYLVSIRPTEQRRREMMLAEYEQSRGRLAAAQDHLERAVAADPWATDARLWFADSLRWQLVSGTDSPELRADWEAAIDDLRGRSGADPAIERLIGEQRMHLLQRFGQPQDARAALRTFSQAVEWSPSHQWLQAQQAVLATALGDSELAARAAHTADELSRLGDNVERSLERQLVYPARSLGRLVITGPVREPAAELLANQLEPESVPSSGP